MVTLKQQLNIALYDLATAGLINQAGILDLNNNLERAVKCDDFSIIENCLGALICTGVIHHSVKAKLIDQLEAAFIEEKEIYQKERHITALDVFNLFFYPASCELVVNKDVRITTGDSHQNDPMKKIAHISDMINAANEFLGVKLDYQTSEQIWSAYENLQLDLRKSFKNPKVSVDEHLKPLKAIVLEPLSIN